MKEHRTLDLIDWFVDTCPTASGVVILALCWVLSKIDRHPMMQDPLWR